MLLATRVEGRIAELPYNQDSTPEAVERRVHGLLSQSPYEELRAIRCECQNGVLTLRGRVSSYYLKFVAQETATVVAPGKAIHNVVKVAPPGN